MEKALQKVFRQKIKLIAASRTDAGAHALGQIVAFEAKTKIPVDQIAQALNNILPEDIKALNTEHRARKFHVRWDAKSKEYEYLIFNGETLSPFLRNYVWHVRPKLNLAAMRQAARLLVGKHDFSSFCAARSDDKDFVRMLHSFVIRNSSLVIWGDAKLKVISFKVKGTGFLYKMVRNIVGTLVEVGMGKRKAAEVKAILLAKDRRKAGRCAPAHGLCLVRVNY